MKEDTDVLGHEISKFIVIGSGLRMLHARFDESLEWMLSYEEI